MLILPPSQRQMAWYKFWRSFVQKLAHNVCLHFSSTTQFHIHKAGEPFRKHQHKQALMSFFLWGKVLEKRNVLHQLLSSSSPCVRITLLKWEKTNLSENTLKSCPQRHFDQSDEEHDMTNWKTITQTCPFRKHHQRVRLLTLEMSKKNPNQKIS